MVNLTNRQHIRDWFAFGSGLFGIWELLRAADWVISAVDIMTGLYRPTTGITLSGAMVHAVARVFLALWLLASARKLVTFWYPDTPPDDKGSSEKESDTKTI
jgi:hypothetical protein